MSGCWRNKRASTLGETARNYRDPCVDRTMLRSRAQCGGASCRQCPFWRNGDGDWRSYLRVDRRGTAGYMARQALWRLADADERDHGHGSAYLLSGHHDSGCVPVDEPRSLLPALVTG